MPTTKYLAQKNRPGYHRRFNFWLRQGVRAGLRYDRLACG